MENVLQVILLGIIQGITEWLPISSSGHLVLAHYFLGVEPSVLLDVLLHIGSLAVIIIVFWGDLLALGKGVIQGNYYHIRYAFLLLLASIPTALIGLIFFDWLSASFANMRLTAYSFIITGLLLFATKIPITNNKPITPLKAFIMGIAQGVAILPAISRSGSTIVAGILQGIDQEEAAKFSFFMFIPAILGATILEVRDIGQVEDIGIYVIGAIAASIAGYFSLRLLMHVIRKGKLIHFGWYCIALGIVLLFIV